MSSFINTMRYTELVRAIEDLRDGIETVNKELEYVRSELDRIRKKEACDERNIKQRNVGV